MSLVSKGLSSGVSATTLTDSKMIRRSCKLWWAECVRTEERRWGGVWGGWNALVRYGTVRYSKVQSGRAAERQSGRVADQSDLHVVRSACHARTSQEFGKKGLARKSCLAQTGTLARALARARLARARLAELIK